MKGEGWQRGVKSMSKAACVEEPFLGSLTAPIDTVSISYFVSITNRPCIPIRSGHANQIGYRQQAKIRA